MAASKKKTPKATPAVVAETPPRSTNGRSSSSNGNGSVPSAEKAPGRGVPLTFVLAALPGALLASGYVLYAQRAATGAGGGGGGGGVSGGSSTKRDLATAPGGEPDDWTEGYYADPLPPATPSTHAHLSSNGGNEDGRDPQLVTFETDADFARLGRLYNDLGQIVPSRRHFVNDTSLYLGPTRPGTHFQWPPVHVGHKRTVPGLFGGDGLPVELETLTNPNAPSHDPRVFYVHNFLSATEAESFIDFSTSDDNPYKMAPSTGGTHKAWNQGGSGATLSTRTSMNAFDITSDVSRLVKRRAFRLLRMGTYRESMADGIQILRYELGQAYVAHHDYFPKKQSDDFSWDPSRGGSNRFATVFLYLSSPEVGGQTVFPKSERLTEQTSADLVKRLGDAPPADTLTKLRDEAGLQSKSWEADLIDKCFTKFAVPPRKGDAILFYSQRPDGALDEASLHGACPVLEGTKWGANVWVWNACRYSMCENDPLRPTDELPVELKAPFAAE